MIAEVTKRYAKALFEVARDKKIEEKVFSNLRTLVESLEKEPTVAEFFSAQVVSSEAKMSVIEKALGNRLEQPLVDTLKLMAAKGRLDLLAELLQAFEMMVDDSRGVTRGTVRSAKVLSPDARKKIEDRVAEVTKKKVILNFKEDPKLLAGMVAQVGGWTFDDTLETHLTHLGEDLNRRAH